MAAFAAVSFHSVSSRRRSRSSSFDYKGLVENAKKEEREALDTLRIIRDKQNAVKEEKHYTKGTSKKEGRKGKFNLLKVLFTPIEIPKNQNEKKSKRSRARYHSMCDNYSRQDSGSLQIDEGEERNRRSYKKGWSYDPSEFKRLVDLTKESESQDECPSPTTEIMRLEIKRSRMMAPMSKKRIRCLSQPEVMREEDQMRILDEQQLIGSEEWMANGRSEEMIERVTQRGELIQNRPGAVVKNREMIEREDEKCIQRGELVENRTGAMIQTSREMMQKRKEGRMHLNKEQLRDVDRIDRLEDVDKIDPLEDVHEIEKLQDQFIQMNVRH